MAVDVASIYMYDGRKPGNQEAPSAVEHKGVLTVTTIGHAMGAPAHYSSYRCAILFLLHEQECCPEDMVVRLTDIGFDPRLVASLSIVLSAMEHDQLVSSWEQPDSGGAPPRRIYRLTRRGQLRLGDSVAVLLRRGDAFGGLVGRYLTIRQADNRRGGNEPDERRASAPW
jgi:DNA-binding PadR family transcriptional regulator